MLLHATADLVWKAAFDVHAVEHPGRAVARRRAVDERAIVQEHRIGDMCVVACGAALAFRP